MRASRPQRHEWALTSHTRHMTTGRASLSEVVIVRAVDGSVFAFEDYHEESDGSLRISGVLEGEGATFFCTDGERLTAVLGEHGWVERLEPTGHRDPEQVRPVLADLARQEGFSWDGDDPSEWVLALRRHEYANRFRPRWPMWLDRWMHGPPPD